MTETNISLPTLSQLHLWRQRFLTLNDARCKAARSLMTSRAQQVFNALPLLLHVNHPRLPGFMNFRVPTGIQNYTPTNVQMEAIQGLARGVQLRAEAGQAAIMGLYLMGSIGSVAQSRTSDLDVWLCYRENLENEDIKILQKKCNLLEEWALEMGVELHFFLMNLSHFRQGQNQSVQGESSGSTQHLLLLDEFYRSSVWLAGCQPRWWLIPNQQEHNNSYWSELLNRHLVNDNDWLDFGSMASIPAAEFVGAGLWQLSKGLNNPYKSLLKLLLTRHYASQYPNSRPLCWDLKQQVHEGNTELIANDGYLFLLNRVSQQLNKEGNKDRVELARRAFYYKVKLPLTEITASQRGSWRAEVLAKLCDDWGWDKYQLERLDERPRWSPNRIAQERNALISEMLSSYQFLLGFSQKYVPKLHISRQDLLSLGNRLYAAFDSRPGKIININPGISPVMAQDYLYLEYKENGWCLIPSMWAEDSSNDERILKQSQSLVELLCFARLNELMQGHTRIATRPARNPLSHYELRQTLSVVNALVQPQPNSQEYLKPAAPLHWVLLVNVGVDPQLSLSRRGMQKISNRDDALGYSSSRENLVQTIDFITVNSWGEWQVEHFSGDDCLLLSLQKIINYLPKAKRTHWPNIQVHCNCASRAPAIRQRVEDAIKDVITHFSNTPKYPYLIEVAEVFYLLEVQRTGVELLIADTPSKLLNLLQRRKDSYTLYALDRTALLTSPLRLVFEQSKAGLWQIFFWRNDGKIYFYFLDERGALLHQQWQDETPDRTAAYWLMPMLGFLKRLDSRWQRQSQRTNARKITLFEIKRKALSYDFELKQLRPPETWTQSGSIELRAMVSHDQQVTLYCNGEEFNSYQYGDQLYQAVADTVHNLRASKGHYPLFLTDLELPDNDNVIEHLQLRQRLESRFYK